ncbi:MAG: UDP-N-acetylmuramate--L-alanine ligase [Candidatus Levybacteria bacterium RIFCSPLOWO2_01_FULL_42_15]|nr:MAG: UDP-N-acetylmuramate--L-alanine ligase [Candidatus Levybacteria bacterium RIFCSPLOWO2_01_FULL_42_15]
MKKKHIHFVGIKGVGLAPLAIIAKEAGFIVSGCDVDEEFITDELLKLSRIQPIKGFSSSHLGNVDMVITTGAHGGFDNPEVQEAKKGGIKVLTHGEAVGMFMKGELFGRFDMTGISVVGSHGKTTTTALLATIFSQSGLDPSYTIGTSIIPSIGASGHYGNGKYFIAEADEYATEPAYNKTPKLLWQYPSIAVITNVDFDHPDVFKNEEDIAMVFRKFLGNIKRDGILVLYGDDPYAAFLKKSFPGKTITYGYSPQNDFVLRKARFGDRRTFFWVEALGTNLGEFCIHVIGEHNALNATGAIAVSLEVGIGINKIKKALMTFSGSKRRCEFIGQSRFGSIVIDDYAHHPTEIKKTLIALKKAYPKKHIVCIFQPHTFSRTKALFNKFTHAFSDADEVILMDIYPSLREEPDPEITSQFLANKMSKIHKSVTFLSKACDVIQYVAQKETDSSSLIVTMGAGDIYKIAQKVAQKKPSVSSQ